MVHRDLKPANLMLIPAPARTDNETSAKSNVKILDIGLAREFFDENSPDMAERAELTGEGVLLGTPDYLAPEQASDPRTIDIRADIYSLGCTLYHCLTGQPPFPDKNILNQMIRHAAETPRPLAEFNPNIPEGLAQIVAWMMAKQPAQRYPTPARAAQAMDAFLMVTATPARAADDSPQLRKYLTWLEGEEKEPHHDPDATIPPPADVPAPVLKPSSGAQVPVASAVPPAKPASNAPSPRRKKRTGGKLVEAPPAAAPAPVNATAPAAIAMPAEPAAGQFDVELVDAPPPTPIITKPAVKGLPLSNRDLLMLGIGVGVSFAFCLLCTGVLRVIGYFFPND
jgi:serine/threonine protein kinase